MPTNAPACPGHLMRLLGLWFLTMLHAPSSFAWATPPNNWEVMRVFVRDDPEQISRIVTRHYATVLLVDLARELAEHNASRKVSLLKTPVLEEAIYIARLEGDLIISDQSRWKLSGPQRPQPMDLGTLSLALRTPRGIAPGGLQLADHALFSPSGGIELPIPVDQAPYWFGFSVSSQLRESERVFTFGVPPAVTGKLLLSTPTSVELSSPTLVIEKVTSLGDQLPNNWTGTSVSGTSVSGTSVASSGSTGQWWLVHLGGVSQVELLANQKGDDNRTRFKHLVRSATVDYLGSSHQLDARAKFVVAGYQVSNPLRLRVSHELKIESVLADGLSVQWRVVPSPQRDSKAGDSDTRNSKTGDLDLSDKNLLDSNLIELMDLTSTERNINIEIHALCPLNTSRPANLPEISVAEGYVLQGESQLSGQGELMADKLLVQDGVARRISRRSVSPAAVPPGTSPSDSSPEPLMWRAFWSGTPPRLEASFSQRRLPATARSLTRFSIQTEWLAANCRMRIESPRLISNEIRLPVGTGWFIDTVRLIGGEGDIRAHVEDHVDATNPVIVIHWEEHRPSLAIELEVLAHSPRELKADTISLRSPRLVSLPQADQTDNYVIESSNRFSVQVGAKLLPYQRQAFDLPVWQQQLLQPTANAWIFQGVRGSIPPINLIATSGTFTSQVVTTVRRTAADSSVTTQILCNPTAGSIDRVSVTIPPGLPMIRWQWSLRQAGEADDDTQLVTETVLAESDLATNDKQQPQTIELELPTSLSTPFTLFSKLPLNALGSDAELLIPMVGVHAAAGGESLLLLPRELTHGWKQMTVEILATPPPEVDDTLAELAREARDTSRQGWVTARLEAGTSQLLRLEQPIPEAPNGWIWSEWLWHTVGDNGQVDHFVQWVVQGTQLEPLHVSLPDDWSVEDVWIDGTLIDTGGATQQLQLEMPQGSVSGRASGNLEGHVEGSQPGRTTVTLRCSSRHQPLRWLSYERLQSPTVSLPILASRATLAIPPSRLAVRHLTGELSTSLSRRLVDRLLPQSLWRLLAPTNAPAEVVAAADTRFEDQRLPPGWSTIELPVATSTLATSTLATLPLPRAVTGVEPVPQTILEVGEWMISRTALSALALAVVLMMAAFLWIVLGVSLRLWWLAATLGVISVVVVPRWLLPAAQLLLLSLSLSALLRLCVVVTTWRNSQPRPRGRSSVISADSLASTTSLVFLLCWCGSAAGQSATSSFDPLTPADPRFANGTSAESVPARPEIFSVLIPVDAEGEVAGAYAYAPTRLLEMLAGGSEGGTRQVTPKILSADYTLRMRRDLSGQPDQIQELSVEFRLQVTQTEVELRLPFDSSQVQLQRGSVSGQELYVGDRWLSQLSDAVVFRPNQVGSLRLQLQLIPRGVTVSENQANLRCAIPPIPNATLRIVADSNSIFEIRSSGTGRKTISSVSTELLGPSPELDVKWSPVSQRSTTGRVVAEIFSDTWLHAYGGQVNAICQMRIENARALPRDLHVIAEAGWEPVGMNWKDGELLASETSALGGRRVYTIRCGENWDQTSRRVLRVLMVPRDDAALGTLAIPFFTLREVSQAPLARTLAWSSEEGATWRPDGLDLWQELTSVPGLEWGEFELARAQRPQLFRVVGTLATSLRSFVPPAAPTIDEMTQVHLALGETKITYRGQFSPSGQSLPLELVFPRQARVESVLVDGNVTNYLLSEREDRATLEILPGDKPVAARIVEVSLSQPLALNRDARLPRVTIQGYAATRSIYRVLCGVGLQCKLSGSSELQLSAVSIPPHELLPALESLVGQVDLRGEVRDAPWLPLEFQVQRRDDSPLLSSVMALRRSEQGWKATVTTRWETGDTPLDFAFFELPLAIRDSLDPGQLPAQLTPLGDTARMTLRILPALPVSGVTEVTFSFALPANSSSQTVVIPAVSILAEQPVRPLLLLPGKIDDQAVEWIQLGRRLEQLPAGVSLAGSTPDDQFFEVDPAQTQVAWKRFESASDRAQLLLEDVTLLSHQHDHVAGYVDYWIAPNGQLELSLAIPDQCQVLGVESGQQSASWTLEHGTLSVLMQPNYLPLTVRVLLHWRGAGADTLALHLPRLTNAQTSEQTLKFAENRLTLWRLATNSPTEVRSELLQESARRWSELFIGAMRDSRTRPQREVITWLKNWHPQRVGIDGDTAIPQATLSNLALILGSDAELPVSIYSANDLWQYAASLLVAQAETQLADNDSNSNDLSSNDSSREALMIPPGLGDAPSPWSTTLPIQIARLTSQQDIVVVSRDKAPSNWIPQGVAAALLVVASLLALFLARRVGGQYLNLLGSQPWVYWLQLSVVAWWFLPLAWPSWVLGATAIGMLASQWLESHRRQRRLARL